jgi:predicted MFS family arabinose efflux permease
MEEMGQKRVSYELGIVALLALLSGTLVMNRLAILYLFPSIISDLKISYAHAGALVSVSAITFAFACWFFGGLSDRIGRKIILIPGAIFFSVMSWVSGIAYSFLQMFFGRGLLGFGGAIIPPSIATISAESNPTRRGFNFGLLMALSPLFGLGIGPLLITQLTKIMSWRMIFFLVGIPGLIISVILYFYMREPKAVLPKEEGGGSEAKGEKPDFFAPLRYRNVIISSIVNFLVIGSLAVFFTFSLIYMTKDLQLSIADAGIILSLFGFAGFFGCILLPLLSDHVGRKPVIIPSLFIMGMCYGGFMFSGSNFYFLAVSLSIGGFISGGIAPIAISALTTESVPPNLAATASGIPLSIGEVFGGSLMPFLLGYFCDLYGLKAAILYAVLASFIAFFIGFLYKETAPKIIGKSS